MNGFSSIPGFGWLSGSSGSPSTSGYSALNSILNPPYYGGTPLGGIPSMSYNLPFGYQPDILSIPSSVSQALGLPDSASMLAALGLVGFGAQQGYNILQNQQSATNLALNPNAMANQILGYQQPLQQNLLNSIMENIGPTIAAQGLGTSPGMTEQILGEALGPYQMQEQQIATNLASQGVMMPFQQGAGGAGWFPQALSSGASAFMPSMIPNPESQILLAMQLQQLLYPGQSGQVGAFGMPSGAGGVP
jgi:hypothetical protein